ncbi:aminoglycoside phosphotransferase family protein [Microbacterium sp. H1-D42]|uniref:aminoglycoside phosphotransferase family protein n=1 Tax=Microbacterium sp. H1-D42 TaxID=2925844 RepID=UPI001F52B723|nr:aminoglycoside phosphotransferase family protein [Microbacterium sp. H1-D42]UNK69586.1 aminoglycoside phosphotransferase family protein [Microbacterium sp. H1-D42]
MSDWHGGRLSSSQAAWVQARVPGATLVRDMSWELMASTVLHVHGAESDVVVKAGDAANHHLDREIAAHDGWTSPLVQTGHAARLIDADVAARVMVLEYLPGVLVQGTPAEGHPSTYAQAGALLRRLHAQSSRSDADHEARVNARALRWLDGEHRVDADVAARARSILSTDPAPAVDLVPTHGDWQPRNWLIDADVVRVIDFGRFAFRPAATDVVRLAAGQWRSRPDLEAAFFSGHGSVTGYGADPRDPERWRMDALREAVGTACWAFTIGDEAFEAQGHRMLTEALGAF